MTKRRSSTRGILLRGYLEGVPSESFEVIAESIAKLTRGKPGIYALYKDDKLYYVGLAKSLRSRVKRHTKDRHSEKWNKFSVYVIEKVRYLKDMETLILRISKPRGNAVRGRLPRQYRLNKILEQEISVQDKKLNKLKKAIRPGLFKPRARKRR